MLGISTTLWWVNIHLLFLISYFVDNTTIYFLKDILGRKKAYIHNDAVKNIHVPQYKNLTVERVLQFASSQP